MVREEGKNLEEEEEKNPTWEEDKNTVGDQPHLSVQTKT
jgi:hypothetical protein